MGRAIVRDPKAFLMDEPLSNLDAKLRVQMRTEVARIQRTLGTTMVYVTHDQTEAMTLGDRVAVMRSGVLQQVGTPMELYNDPANLFVAGFIGSPSMNFLPAEIEGDRVRLPIGDVPAPQGQRPSGGRLIAGIRPEHFEDAALVDERDQGITFKTKIDVVESMGSEFYAYFTIDETAESEELADLAADTGGESSGGNMIVARLNPASSVKQGEEAELWLDPSKIQYFDGENGTALARKQESAGAT
jgi:multiple sugar transport system ATP-binding protein